MGTRVCSLLAPPPTPRLREYSRSRQNRHIPLRGVEAAEVIRSAITQVMGAAAVLLALLVAAVGVRVGVGVGAARNCSHRFPSPGQGSGLSMLEVAGIAVAAWSHCKGGTPWELSKLEDADIMHSKGNTKQQNIKWEDKTVHYVIEETDFTEIRVSVIIGILKILSTFSCVKFVPLAAGGTAKDFVRITGKKEGCFTEYWGRKGGEQRVNLQSPWCVDAGPIYHEMFHVLGFRHIHNRPDRDKHIQIFWDNIDKADHKHFEVYKKDENLTDFGLGYDIQSNMHFGRKAYSKNGKNTIAPLPPFEYTYIGSKGRPSDKDITKLNLLYECGESEAT